MSTFSSGPAALPLRSEAFYRESRIELILGARAETIDRASRSVMLRDGRRIQEVTDGQLEINGGKDRGSYRVEAYTRNAPGRPPVPWMVSNPIYAGLETKAADIAPNAEPQSRSPARMSETAAELGSNDTSTVEVNGDSTMNWRFALAPGTPAGQFAAVRIPVSGGLTAFDRVRLLAVVMPRVLLDVHRIFH